MEIGDTVIREFYGKFMALTVTDITPDHIVCGDRFFLKETMGEIDLELGCDGKRMAVSRIYLTIHEVKGAVDHKYFEGIVNLVVQKLNSTKLP